MMATPILSQNIIINEMIRGEAVSWSNIGISVAGTFLVGMVLAWIAVRLYNKESMLFSD